MGDDNASKFYGYVPTLYICIIFLSLFVISTALHIGQAIYYRRWYLLITVVLCSITESIGWGGRTWSHWAPQNLTPYLIQIVTTINAPTLLIAAYFVTLAEVIRRLGPCYSRLKPRMYTIVFCLADLGSLTIQGVGGGLAATAAATDEDPELGGRIMLAGIAVQVVAITLFAFTAAEFLIRFIKDKPFNRPTHLMIRGTHPFDIKMRTMVGAIVFATICLFIRSIYRLVELTDGWTGRIITTEVYFNVLDGAMVLAATLILNLRHPGMLLPNDRPIVDSTASTVELKIPQASFVDDAAKKSDSSYSVAPSKLNHSYV